MQDTDDATLDLTGKLLIAMPGMGDPRFDRSVIFICAHSAEGAMGLIINKPTPELAMTATSSCIWAVRWSMAEGLCCIQPRRRAGIRALPSMTTLR